MKEKIFNFIVFLIFDICLTYSLVMFIGNQSIEKSDNKPNKTIIVIKVKNSNSSNEQQEENTEDGEEQGYIIIDNVNGVVKTIKFKDWEKGSLENVS